MIIEKTKSAVPKDPFKDPRSFSNSVDITIKSVNLSFIQGARELFTFSLVGLRMQQLATDMESIVELGLNRL